jgi:hypothetical protein
MAELWEEGICYHPVCDHAIVVCRSMYSCLLATFAMERPWMVFEF